MALDWIAQIANNELTKSSIPKSKLRFHIQLQSTTNSQSNEALPALISRINLLGFLPMIKLCLNLRF
ncbi:hypothetical protein FACHB389_23970 [Nostoc calcicola FACHB-389]|nr:hypothetical protein FACHB389_23970 [Nostoc calcicola FACHB-389]